MFGRSSEGLVANPLDHFYHCLSPDGHDIGALMEGLTDEQRQSIMKAALESGKFSTLVEGVDGRVEERSITRYFNFDDMDLPTEHGEERDFIGVLDVIEGESCNLKLKCQVDGAARSYRARIIHENGSLSDEFSIEERYYLGSRTM